MDQPVPLLVILFVATAIFLVFALAVRFAGASRPLNFVEYSRVTDAAALHRWTGNRMLLLPLASLAAAMASLVAPASALLILLAWALVVVAVVLWLAVGSGKFHHTR